ncbi:MAG: DNA mismatch repair protein MutH [Sandaracinaceae bacterium]|nr:DNA mismatch repair protein MutH [Sandaracinaceae bacterium]
MPTEPADAAELLARARALGGRTVGEVARELGVALPPDPRRAKGFVGKLAEHALGAGHAGDGPDFAGLGVELKTLPIADGRVAESTFVCSAPLSYAEDLEWEASRVRRKLSRVLFLAVARDRPPRFGAAFLWTPSPAQEAVLRADWEELTGLIGAGDVEAIDARRGRWLQLRPKGANAAARAKAHDGDGAPFWAPRRAFYLRRAFTAELLLEQGFVTREASA